MLRTCAGLSYLLLTAALALVALAPAGAGAAGWAPVASDVVPAGPTGLGPSGLTLSGAGAITAEWVQGLGAADLMVADRPAGGPWGAPQRISGGAGVNGASLVANAAGAQASAWLEGGYVRVATRAPGAAWQAVAVPLSGAGITGAPVLAIAPDGTVVVSWLDGGLVEVSVRGVSGAFSSPVTIPAGTDPASLAVAAGPGSDVLLVWSDTNGAQGRVMAAYRPAGGPSFQAPVAALAAAPNAGTSLYLAAPQVVFDPAGEAGLIWLRTVVDNGANTTTSIWEGKWRTAGAGGTFQGAFPHSFESRTINTTLPTALNTGALAADASGRTSFVWPPLAAGGGLAMASRTSGGGFGPTQTVLSSGLPRIDAAAAGGNLLVFDGRVPAVAVAPPGAALGAFDAAPFAAATGTGSAGVVAGDVAGDAAALWVTKTGSAYGLHATVYDATAPEARDVVIPSAATAGTLSTFSVTPWDALTAATAAWDFGDGTTGTGATVQHSYDTAGDRTVTVTIVDQGGNSTTTTRTVAVASAPATPPAGAVPPAAPRPLPEPIAAAPVLSRVKLTHTAFAVGPLATSLTGRARVAAKHASRAARGTVVRWRLSAPATVRLTIATVPRRGKRSRALGTLRRTAPAGPAQMAFSGRVGRRALAPGAYRLTLTPTGAAGRVGKPVVVRFQVRAR